MKWYYTIIIKLFIYNTVTKYEPLFVCLSVYLFVAHVYLGQEQIKQQHKTIHKWGRMGQQLLMATEKVWINEMIMMSALY